MAKQELSVPRRQWAIRLSQVFTNEYEDMIKHYKLPQQEELTEHLIGMLNIMYDYALTKKGEDYERYSKSVNDLQKKYGKAIEPFTSKQFYLYFYFENIISIKNIISNEEYNALPDSEEQTLNPNEIKGFVHLTLNYLYHSRNSLWAKREPEFETSLSGTAETNGKIKGVIKRESGDNMTKLNQEQTALLIHYLQEARILLKDEYLNDTQAGKAFSILTGYSADTLRQNLSKTALERITNKKNLADLTDALNFIQGFIDKDFKAKK